MTAELKPNSVPVFWIPRKSLNEPVPALRMPPPNTAPLITAVDPWVLRSTSNRPSAVRSVIWGSTTDGSFSSLSKVKSPLMSTRMVISKPLPSHSHRTPLGARNTPGEFPAKFPKLSGLLATSGGRSAFGSMYATAGCDSECLMKHYHSNISMQGAFLFTANVTQMVVF